MERQGVLVMICTLILGSCSQDIVFENSASSEDKCEASSRCVPITSCPSVLQNVHLQNPRSCGYIKNIPLVCCSAVVEDDEKNTIPETGNPSISAPAVNFECGKRSSRVVPQRSVDGETPSGGTLVRRRRVVGGRPVSATTVWPWLALVGAREAENEIKWYCVASLINHQWLITAYHCFNTKNMTVVRLGEHDYSDPHDGAHPQDFDIDEVILHPNYTFPMGYNDLALIKLSRNVELKEMMSPVCLPWGQEITTNVVGRDLLLTGWGTTQFGGERSPLLHEVNMTVFESSVCNNSYSQLRSYSIDYPRGIDHTFLCMGHPQGGTSACQGDSGGPLMYFKNESRRYVLAGVVSRGFGCGAQEYPGVHTNLLLESRLAWIKKVAFT